MNPISKPYALIATTVAATLLLLGINTLSPQKFAHAQTSTLDGTCVGAINFTRKGVVPKTDQAVNAFFKLNIEISKNLANGEFSLTHRQYIGNVNDEFVSVDPSYPKGYRTIDVQNVSFSINNGIISGSYVATPTNAPNFPTFNFIPTSGGSYLIQVLNDDIIGICQKA